MSVLKRWRIEAHTWLPGDPPGGRDIEIDVDAYTTKTAMITAVHTLDLAEGELFHWFHIGAPRDIDTKGEGK